jgi:2-phosphoglycerate kinase
MNGNNHLKYILLPYGNRKTISPMFVVGHLVVAGYTPKRAFDAAERIIEDIPDDGISEADFFGHIIRHIPAIARTRFVTLELMKKFFVSPRARGPLFVFLGGFTGKTFLSTYIQQHLGINRVTALDEEKYIVKQRNPDAEHLKKATYEAPDVYEKTVESFYPRMLERMEEHLHDYSMHKKWVYFWEGIYIYPSIVDRLKEAHPSIYNLTIVLLPDIEEIKRRYKLRWMSEFGASYMRDNASTIEQYLKNVEHIKDVIMDGATSDNCLVISDDMFENVLREFYDKLLWRLDGIAEKNGITPWIANVVEDPTEIVNYETFLERP